MPNQPPAPAGNPPFAGGSIIWEKKGPLPVWAWALLLLGLVLAVTMWRRNSAGSPDVEAPASVPDNQNQRPIFILPPTTTPAVNVNVPATVPAAPPGGGSSPPLNQPPSGPTRGPRLPSPSTTPTTNTIPNGPTPAPTGKRRFVVAPAQKIFVE